MADLAKDQTFPSEQLEQEKSRIIKEIKTKSQERPGLTEMLGNKLFPDHPYSFDSLGTLPTIIGITSEDLRKAYGSLVVPRNTVIACAGDIDLPKTINLITDLFGNISDKAFDLPIPSVVVSDESASETLLRDPCGGAGYVAGFRGPKYSDTTLLPLELLDKILFAADGRLSRKLSRSGIEGFSVTSFIRPGLDPGLISLEIVCKPPELSLVSKIVGQELETVRNQLVTTQELADAKRILVSERLKFLGTSRSRADSIATNTLYGLGYDYDDQYPSKLAAVTSDHVRQAALSYLDPNRCVVLRILPQETEGKKE